MKLDIFDKKILALLQRDNRISQRELSVEVNLSASAINRRIATMEKAGVIKNSVTVVNSHKVGRPITIITQVSLINERLDLLEKLKKNFTNCPQVQQVYYVTGDFDFLLIINVRDMEEYERLTHELFFKSENIQSFKTFVSMQNAKQELTVFLG
ncbi:Lrp/AsnC family transcriptional regulator [Providencia rettgeri]|uniref:Lrp/AsnC family transcriptional regulator n=1 Tax=Providencia rettgeri TaxID=587 RepID=UPI00029BF8AA|nr:Lrp/AsnC family transcriptional regulator [Providencia rettgeri]EKT56837.1 regulator for leucine (or lrp) regulon and high-affinity branched-chain amino acid transport system [Providencia rettgeri Dmel1]